MEKQNLNEIDMLKLDADLLEKVTGGVMPDSLKAILKGILMQAKSSGMSLSDVLGKAPGYYDSLHNLCPEVTTEELEAYIKDVWDTF